MSKGAGKKPKPSDGPQAVAEVFSLGRDIEVQHPYHLDGDMEMYSEEKMEVRGELRKDEEIVKELQEVQVKEHRLGSSTTGRRLKG